MDKNECLSVIEGMIFLAGDEGVDARDICNVLELTKKEVYEFLDELMDMYSHREVSGIDIINYGGVFKMVTRAKHTIYYQKMVQQEAKRLSQAALETLAIIAYYQPITRVRIEEIRGVGCEAMIRKLIAKALIKDVGREETPGRPILYGVTDEFMDAFALTSLDELPKLKEITSDFDEDNIFNTKYTEKDKAE